MKVYALFQHNKKNYQGTAWMQVFFFPNAAVLSRKILAKSTYWIGTQY